MLGGEHGWALLNQGCPGLPGAGPADSFSNFLFLWGSHPAVFPLVNVLVTKRQLRNLRDTRHGEGCRNLGNSKDITSLFPWSRQQKADALDRLQATDIIFPRSPIRNLQK